MMLRMLGWKSWYCARTSSTLADRSQAMTLVVSHNGQKMQARKRLTFLFVTVSMLIWVYSHKVLHRVTAQYHQSMHEMVPNSKPGQSYLAHVYQTNRLTPSAAIILIRPSPKCGSRLGSSGNSSVESRKRNTAEPVATGRVARPLT